MKCNEIVALFACLLITFSCDQKRNDQSSNPAVRENEALSIRSEAKASFSDLEEKGDIQRDRISFSQVNSQNLDKLYKQFDSREPPTEFSKAMVNLLMTTRSRLEENDLSQEELNQLVRVCRDGLFADLGHGALKESIRRNNLIGWTKERLERSFGPANKTEGNAIEYIFDDGYAVTSKTFLLRDGVVVKVD